MAEVQNDPDRLTRPLRRRADGTLEAITWEVASDEIGTRLAAVRETHGNESVGVYMGNPMAFATSVAANALALAGSLGTRHFYTTGSQDTNSRFVASKLLYGSPFAVPIPDIPRTEFLLMLGANPLVSHGSLFAGGLVRDDLEAVVARGGRVVVVDPRRTETAKRFEHVSVPPDSDAWLLLSLLNVVFAEGLYSPQAREVATGVSELQRLVAPFTPEATAIHTSVEPDLARALARDFASAHSAAAYGRVGACLGSRATLVNFLLDALNVVTGNLDRPGGSVFATPPLDFMGTAIKQGLDTYAQWHSRIGGYPEVFGSLPAGVMAREITTPGPGQLRALFVLGGNPALSVPDSGALRAALGELDLLVSIDIYANESAEHADYVLPARTWLEREDFNLFAMPYQYRPFIQWTAPVVEPRGEARDEIEILRDIFAAAGVVLGPTPRLRRFGHRVNRMLSARRMIDMLLRVGYAGDRFGLRRSGWSRKRLLTERPHGVKLADAVATNVLERILTTADKKVHVSPPQIAREIARLAQAPVAATGLPLKLFGRRELRSINSWMHNSAKLNPKLHAPPLWMHPDDAAPRGVNDGDDVRIRSALGALDVRVAVTADVAPGSVSLPHAWGHDGTGGWQRANRTGGANYNVLVSTDELEPLAAMSILSGVAVEVERSG